MLNKKKKTIDWLIQNYLSFFEKFGMNEGNIIRHHKSWKENRPDIIEDYLWYIFNRLLIENKHQSRDLIEFYERNRLIYSEMISFRRKIEGKKANEIQNMYNRNIVELELEKNSENGIAYDFTVITPQDCKACQHLTDKVISKREALENNTIPYENCTRTQGCVCLISIMPRRDENGRLIFI
ncbi:MAG: hypothetical protein ABGW99_11025 [Zunongwangia sp.]|uniref:hypothetical protein n=1 Tax=Zunongwangia sp. TaxID=1965325 RepID=UPI003242C65B